jgi:Cu(I)/Ag(I) efflux system membrane protein CusA/SilA
MVGRRTGRAELDEHAEGVNNSDLEVRPKPGVPKEIFQSKVRKQLGTLPGVIVNIGQPISHRIDHMLTGVRAQITVKVAGEDLEVLRKTAREVQNVMRNVPGVVDLNLEQQIEVPQIKIFISREAAARYGLSVGEVARILETSLKGATVSQVVRGARTFDLVVWTEESARNNLDAIRKIPVSTPSGAKIPIEQIAEIVQSTGPNTINKENNQRRVTVSCNVQDRDLNGVIQDIQKGIKDRVQLQPGYFITYGGEFESQQAASRTIFVLGFAAVIGIFLVLNVAFKSWKLALQVMVNMPLAMVGGVIATALTGATLSIASLVGFVTLFGIATRNGVLMLSHYMHLMREEGEPFGKEMVVRGTLERLSPVLMTALCASLGLLPLAIAVGQPGREIMQPMAVVILGGLITSTLLDQMVTPALFYRFYAKEAHKLGNRQY